MTGRMLACGVLRGSRFYVALMLLYCSSRAALYALGVRYGADYAWQHFHDVELLEHRLWESLLYTHAFTPFINLLAGLVLKASEQHAVAIYHTLYLGLGAVFVEAMGAVAIALGVSRPRALALVTFFSLTPAFIYFENFLHYEFIAAALLMLSAYLAYRASKNGGFMRWTWFFAVCALIAYVRTTFHLVWLVAMLGLMLMFNWRSWRVIVGAAIVPMLLVVALYAKNQVLFGFFGTSSMLGFNLAYVTTRQLKPQELERWVATGKAHPASQVDVYAGPEAYAEWVPVTRRLGIPVLDQFTRGNGQPNYNHWSYADVSKLRMQGTRYYLAHRRAAYLRTVVKNLKTFFRPTSTWHPSKTAGPHALNRRVIGGWEQLYNAALHGWPAPFGLYALLLPLALLRGMWAIARQWQRRLKTNAREKLALLLLLNTGYVIVLSCLVTTAELARYRLLIEGFVWLLTAAALKEALARLRSPALAAAPATEGSL